MKISDPAFCKGPTSAGEKKIKKPSMNRIENNIEGMKMSTEGKFLRSKTWDQKPTQNNFNCEDKGDYDAEGKLHRSSVWGKVRREISKQWILTLYKVSTGNG